MPDKPVRPVTFENRWMIRPVGYHSLGHQQLYNMEGIIRSEMPGQFLTQKTE